MRLYVNIDHVATLREARKTDEPDPVQAAAAAERAGADGITVHLREDRRRAATHAKQIGLAVHAGHGLTYQNVEPVAAIPEIEELNIGHSIVSNAVFWGLEEAVRRMVALVSALRVDVAADRRGGRRVRERADGDQ